MRKIIVDLNRVKDDEYVAMYEIFGLDVLNKSYEDFECFKFKLKRLSK